MRCAILLLTVKPKTQAANVMKATGSKGVNCFMLLPDNDRTKQCFPDLMHNLKNVVVHFFDLFTGKGYSEKVKHIEVELGRFKEPFANLEKSSGGAKKSKDTYIYFLTLFTQTSCYLEKECHISTNNKLPVQREKMKLNMLHMIKW